jgi:hypothetical protein
VALVLTLAVVLWYTVETRKMAVATRDAAEASRDSIRELALTRDAATRPHVVVYPEHGGSEGNRMEIAIRNVGASAAYNVSVTIEPPLPTDPVMAQGLEHVLSEGIPYLPPGAHMRFLFSNTRGIPREDLKRRRRIGIKYEGPREVPRSEEYDVGLFENLRWYDTSGPMDRIVDELRNIRTSWPLQR